jgi:putative component of membrane protein insertase Oxa1/YidC/SpoIIIJ protein YidD
MENQLKLWFNKILPDYDAIFNTFQIFYCFFNFSILAFSKMRSPILILILLVCMVPLYSGIADTGTKAYDILIISGKADKEGSIHRLISFYQTKISPLNEATCLFYPTCSAFYGSAISEYGFLWGTLMTLDRLLYREGWGSMRYYRYLKNKDRYFDPVYHNYIFRKTDYYR